MPYEKRGKRTNEYIEAIKELWISDEPSYEGEFCSFSGIKFYPKPLQKPHPPIFIAGASDYAIKRAVELGDGWQPTWVSPEDVKEGISKLKNIANEKGRDLNGFTYSVRNRLDIIGSDYNPPNNDSSEGNDPPFLLRGTVSEITESIKAYKYLGVSHLVLDPVANELDDIHKIMEIVAKEIIPAINN